MLKEINAQTVIDPISEIHYSILKNVDPLQYPQVHDFYELILVLEGKLELRVDSSSYIMLKNNLMLIKPNEVHSKKIEKLGTHINLAFPKKLLEDLYLYLRIESEIKSKMIVSLTQPEAEKIVQMLEKVNLIPLDSKTMVRTNLRFLLFNILTQYFIKIPEINELELYNGPNWFKKFLSEINSIKILDLTNDEIISKSNCSKEHTYRTFKKILNMTPNEYINNIRLNYVANLLITSEQSITEIIFQVGFQNVSYFYSLFKQKYKISPYKFRKKYSKIKIG